jgi:hypothetical protein
MAKEGLLQAAPTAEMPIVNAASAKTSSTLIPESRTPWQEIYCASVSQLDDAAPQSLISTNLQIRGVPSLAV